MSDLENQKSGLWQKVRNDPLPAVGNFLFFLSLVYFFFNYFKSCLCLFINIGVCGLLGVVAYSLYNYRNKSAGTKTSVYVIQTRVAAQGVVIGTS